MLNRAQDKVHIDFAIRSCLFYMALGFSLLLMVGVMDDACTRDLGPLFG
jgi:hypothetical protein